MNRSFIFTTALGCILGLTAAVQVAVAAPRQSSPAPADTEGELNVENDRTLQRTRIRLEDEFIDYKSGDSLNTLTHSGGFAFALRLRCRARMSAGKKSATAGFAGNPQAACGSHRRREALHGGKRPHRRIHRPARQSGD